MKKWVFIIILLSILSCKEKESHLIGDWNLQSKFYSATYRIQQEGKKLNALILYHNDNTSVYKYDGNQSHFIFEGMKKKGNHYVDGASGATNKTNDSKNIEIKEKHSDTLEVTSYIMGKPLIEIWTRKKETNEKIK